MSVYSTICLIWRNQSFIQSSEVLAILNRMETSGFENIKKKCFDIQKLCAKWMALSCLELIHDLFTLSHGMSNENDWMNWVFNSFRIHRMLWISLSVTLSFFQAFRNVLKPEENENKFNENLEVNAKAEVHCKAYMHFTTKWCQKIGRLL